MLHRVTALALVALFAAGGLTVCPAGLCPMVRKAANDCCTKGDGLKRPDCCPDAAQTAPSLLSTAAAERITAAQVWLGPGAAVPAIAAVRVAGALPTSLARGPSPPASLFKQQTSLLL